MRIVIDWPKRLRELGIFLAIGTFLTIINPYGATSRMPFVLAWCYWTGMIIYGATIGEVCSRLFTKLLADWPVLVLWLIVASATALFITPVIALISAGSRFPIGELPKLYGLVWVISAAMTGIGFLMSSANEKTQTPPAETGTGSEIIIRTYMSRLPLPYRNGELYAISSEDHYLRMHTSAGEHLILDRLADAIRELDGADGLQTHRSWWVAADGVEKGRSANGRILLRLKSGAEAPVSRTYAKAVREAGWV